MHLTTFLFPPEVQHLTTQRGATKSHVALWGQHRGGLQREAVPWKRSLEHTPQPSANPLSCWDLGSLGPALSTQHTKCWSFQAALGPSLVHNSTSPRLIQTGTSSAAHTGLDQMQGLADYIDTHQRLEQMLLSLVKHQLSAIPPCSPTAPRQEGTPAKHPPWRSTATECAQGSRPHSRLWALQHPILPQAPHCSGAPSKPMNCQMLHRLRTRKAQLLYKRAL